MSNIVLFGFNPLVVEDLTVRINEVVKKPGLESDSVVTFVNSTVRRCSDNKPEPFVVVRCTEQKNIDAVSQALNDELGLGVEKGKPLDDFLPPNPGCFWNQEGR